MAGIRINKTDAARRQLNEAIEMFFYQRDFVSIHTLAAAAFRILRDLSENIEQAKAWKAFKDTIKPGMEDEFFKLIHRPSNFFKHANIDPDEILEGVDDKLNDTILYMSCVLYSDLGNTPSLEMRVFAAWFEILHPDVLVQSEDSERKKLIKDIPFPRDGFRVDQVVFGKDLLEHARSDFK